jgi:hypothetical protein
MTFTNSRPLGRSGTITAAEVERARAVPIQEEVARRGAKLGRRGRHSFVGPCPVCGGDDRFAISIRRLSAIIDLLSAALAATPVTANNEQLQAPTRSVNGGVA